LISALYIILDFIFANIYSFDSQWDFRFSGYWMVGWGLWFLDDWISYTLNYAINLIIPDSSCTFRIIDDNNNCCPVDTYKNITDVKKIYTKCYPLNYSYYKTDRSHNSKKIYLCFVEAYNVDNFIKKDG